MSNKTRATLGLAITTKNEAHYIEACIKSVPFADEIVVVDTQSTDGTPEKAKSLGARVIVREDPGVRDQKQFALEQIKSDWILVLDPDEWLTPESQVEIQKLLERKVAANGFQIPRFHVFMHRIIRNGKGVDHPIRLVRRGCAAYDHATPHESIVPEGITEQLKEGMIHDSTPSIERRVWKIQNETNLELGRAPDRPPTLKELFINPFIYFVSMTFRQGGYKDGIPGVILIGLFSCQLFIMHAKFYENYYNKRQRSG